MSTKPDSRTDGPRFRRQQGWEARWRRCLPTPNGHVPRVAFSDFDNAILEDQLVHLLLRHSPRDSEGVQAWKRRHDSWVAGDITNGENLFGHFVELTELYSLEELVAHLREGHQAFAGVRDLHALFGEFGVHMVGITNAMLPFATATLDKHGLPIPFISNNITFDEEGLWLEYLHEADEMIRKDHLVLVAIEHGVLPLVAIGDSMADQPMFREVLAAGGFGIAVGEHALRRWALAEIADGRLQQEQIVFVPHNRFDDEVLRQVRARLDSRPRDSA